MKHLTALLCTAAICAASYAAEPITTKPAFQTLQSQGGRYAFGQVSEYRSDRYMLDTQTGQLWQMVEYTNGMRELRAVFYQSWDDSVSITPPDFSKPPPVSIPETNAPPRIIWPKK